MIVVGAGRVGRLLGQGVPIIRRGEAVAGEGPVVVCTQARDVPGVVVPEALRARMVFVQNGAFTLSVPTPSLGVLWFAAPGDGSFVTDRESVFWGPEAATVVTHCRSLGLAARVEDDAGFAEAWAEKMLWSAVFGELGERYGEGARALAAREVEVRALVARWGPVLARVWPPQMGKVGARSGGLGGDRVESLCAYSRVIGDFGMRRREWELRGGWIEARV